MQPNTQVQILFFIISRCYLDTVYQQLLCPHRVKMLLVYGVTEVSIIFNISLNR